mmetsp:Transcript_54600/g.66993  ORF Transcript_54600/g.66993 Transcript_54600/m.66993 type:complete len:118 (-) Transcript_54600:25-378(-)
MASRRIGVLPTMLLLCGASLAFSATKAVELRPSRSLRGFQCGPLKVAKMEAAPPEELEDFEKRNVVRDFPKKAPVGQLLFLDCVLLAAAFFINLKCARKLQGVLHPEAFWGRLFVWI